MAFTIKLATAEDMPEISAMLERSYSVLLAPDYDADVLRVTLPVITQAKPSLIASGKYFVARFTETGALAGAGGWADSLPGGAAQAQGLGHIRHVAVDPAFTRLGVARLLIGRILDQARAEGVLTMSCLSTLTAVPFYQSQGFHPVADRVLNLAGETPFPITEMAMRLGQ